MNNGQYHIIQVLYRESNIGNNNMGTQAGPVDLSRVM